jgi:hypothetical protein
MHLLKGIRFQSNKKNKNPVTDFCFRRHINRNLPLNHEKAGLAAQSEIDHLFNSYRGEEGVISLYIPGFLCRMTLNIR